MNGAKPFQAAQVLNCGNNEVLGVLVRWLAWVDAHCASDETRLTEEQVDDVCQKQGAAFALECLGWVTVKGGFVYVIDFDKYLSPTSKTRSMDAARQQMCRARRKARKKERKDTAEAQGGKEVE